SRYVAFRLSQRDRKLNANGAEEHACAVAMGLHRPGDLYNTCIRSLNKTLSGLDQARLVATHQRACALNGLKAGTPDYAVCVVNAEQSSADANGYWENAQ